METKWLAIGAIGLAFAFAVMAFAGSTQRNTREEYNGKIKLEQEKTKQLELQLKIEQLKGEQNAKKDN